MVRVHNVMPAHDREMIDAAGTYRRSGLGSENESLRKKREGLQVTVCLVVESGYVQSGGKPVVHYGVKLVHSAGDRSGRVKTVTNVLKEHCGLPSSFRPLRRNLVSYAPHHHGSVVAEVSDHIDHILFRPFVEKSVVSVAAFRHVPLVKRLYHKHKAHRVA